MARRIRPGREDLASSEPCSFVLVAQSKKQEEKIDASFRALGDGAR